MKCRHCFAELPAPFLDLGFAPPSNDYLSKADLSRPEVTYPLRLRVCSRCGLAQTEDYAEADALFREDYAYFSSTSRSWLRHAETYVDMISERFGLNSGSFVIEVASNDGYLLKNFVAAGVPCLGVEPTDATADAAERLGVPVERAFFGAEMGARLAAEGRAADLICGNNVYAHVPDINDFTQGLAAALKPHGVVTLEFPHLLKLLSFRQFDTVYHEHFSYLSLGATQRIFEAAGLRVVDVEEIPTHGGSLRVYGRLATGAPAPSAAVARVLADEAAFGLETPAAYADFQSLAEAVKNAALEFLLTAKRDGRSVAGYGAAAKGNTLLNFAGVGPDLLPFVSDAAPAKQGKYLPGSHIPILPVEAILQAKPDYVVILPWNIADEIRAQLAPLAEAGARFVTFVPELRIR